MSLIDQLDLGLLEKVFDFADCIGWWKKQKLEQMLDKLDSFYIHVMIKICILVNVY